MSILIVTLAAPILAARQRDPVQATKNLILFFAGFCVLYVLYVGFVHTNLFVPQR